MTCADVNVSVGRLPTFHPVGSAALLLFKVQQCLEIQWIHGAPNNLVELILSCDKKIKWLCNSSWLNHLKHEIKHSAMKKSPGCTAGNRSGGFLPGGSEQDNHSWCMTKVNLLGRHTLFKTNWVLYCFPKRMALIIPKLCNHFNKNLLNQGSYIQA